MNKKILIGGLVFIVLAGIVYYVVAQNSPKQIGQTMTYEETAPENLSMGDGNNNTPATDNGATEQAFLEHMIPHHMEAVAAAKTILNSGQTNAEVNALARTIISAQEKEIADMKAWYKAWYGVEYADAGTYTPMMRDLSALSGDELNRTFLEDMIAHHTGALLQAQAVAPAAKHPETLALAQAIAETQSNEIITMRMIIKQLPKEVE